jgi:hypothetical protein
MERLNQFPEVAQPNVLLAWLPPLLEELEKKRKAEEERKKLGEGS